MTVKVTCNCRITSYSSQSLHSYSKASSEISHYHTFIKDGDKGALQFHYHGITIFTIIFSSLLMHFFFHSPYAFLPLWSFSFALPHSLPTSCVLSLKWIFMFPYNAFFLFTISICLSFSRNIWMFSSIFHFWYMCLQNVLYFSLTLYMQILRISAFEYAWYIFLV